MMRHVLSIKSSCGALEFDASVGHIPFLQVTWEGRRIEPLFTAPWRDEREGDLTDKLPPVLSRLGGDFFCAPFATPADPDVPAHGWPANSAWEVLEQRRGSLTCRLARTVSGATITKRLDWAEDAPLLYQEHRIEGGAGVLPVACHPMLSVQGKGRFFTSQKRAALTFPDPFEPGRSVLAYPARAEDLARFPSSDGGTIDLGRWPIGTRHEDFVTLVEAGDDEIGWSAVIREAEDDLVFFLKNAKVLPVTMLWFSNGGRDYPPWNGRVTGVTGIEDGCCPALAGEAMAGHANPVSAEGVPTGLMLERATHHVVRRVMGAVPRPSGFAAIADISINGSLLTIADGAGRQIEFPWRNDFLTERT